MNRFLWVAGGDLRKLKLAALCQFTLVGAPVIYYGTEVGLSQHEDVMQHGRAIHEEARLPMLWGAGQDQDLFAFYKDLISLRKNHSALRRGTRTTLFSDDKLLVYRRSDQEENIVIALNISKQEVSFELELKESALAFATSPECAVQNSGSRERIILPPFGGIVLQ
jgi:glycosidase